MVLTNRKTA